MDIHTEIISAVGDIVSPVYLVGGSVRDIILNREPKDYDFTTPLSPDEVEAKVKAAGRRPYLIGKKFGTIGFKVSVQGRWQYIEVTTFRSEKYTPGSRKPQVEFVSDLQEDLSRRDFTINAIALHNGEYIDPFGGRLDIIARKIKPVGSAKDRFKDDPLRMLRAARFAAQLRFEVDPNTIGVMRKMVRTIYTVSRERWVQELDKLLVSGGLELGLAVLIRSTLLKFIVPEAYRVFTVPSLQADTITRVLNSGDTDEAWGALCYYIGNLYVDEDDRTSDSRLITSEMAIGICSRLKFSNQRTQTILDYVARQA